MRIHSFSRSLFLGKYDLGFALSMLCDTWIFSRAVRLWLIGHPALVKMRLLIQTPCEGRSFCDYRLVDFSCIPHPLVTIPHLPYRAPCHLTLVSQTVWTIHALAYAELTVP